MPLFKITFLNSDLVQESITLDAEDKDHAVLSSGIDKSIIISVSKKINIAGADLFKFTPTIDDQILLLSTLSGVSKSGAPIRQAVIEFLRANKKSFNIKDFNEIDNTLQVAVILRNLNFFYFVPTLIDVGYRTSKLNELLDTCVDSLKQQRDLKKRADAGLKPAIAMLSMSLVFMVLLPLITGNAIDQVIGNDGIKINTNFLTDFFMTLNHLYIEYWPLLVGGILSIVFSFSFFWKFLRSLPFFSGLWELQKINSTLFLFYAYKPLFNSGIDTLTSLNLIREHAPSNRRKELDVLISKVSEGTSFSSALNSEDAPLITKLALNNFDSIELNSQKNILDSTMETLLNVKEIYTLKISKSMKTISIILVAVLVLSMFLGIVLPLQSITPG